jgi:type VI secretion system protein VasG
MNIFYQVFDKGVLSDGEGREISFRNTVVILTSNLATDKIMDMHADGGVPDVTTMVDTVRPVLSKHFKPALLARMTIVPFRPLPRPVMTEIAQLKLDKLAGRLREAHDVETTFAPEVIEHLVAQCTSAETGARGLDHILRGSVTPRLARSILERLAADDLPKHVHVNGDLEIDVPAVAELPQQKTAEEGSS